MGLWDAITGRTTPKPANLDALFLVPSAAITLQTAAGLHARPASGRSASARPTGAAFQQTQDDVVGAARRRPGRARRRRSRATTSASPGWSRTGEPDDTAGAVSPTCTPSTPRSRRRASARACSARWSPFADAAGRTARAGLPLQAGHLLPVRAHRARSRATTCSRSRSATSSPASCRWSRTSAAGWPCGAPPACEPIRAAP